MLFLSPWIFTNKIYIPNRENKNTKISINVLVATEIIFRSGDFTCFVAKNNVFAALDFVACAIFDSRHLWRRKLRKRQNRERQLKNIIFCNKTSKTTETKNNFGSN